MELDRELQSQLDRYRLIIENAGDVVWETDRDFVFSFLSPNAEGLVGYGSDEMIGRKFTEFLTKESLDSFLNLIASQWKGQAGKTPNQHAFRFICKDGSVIWTEMSVIPLFNDGQITGYAGTARDITEKKEHERHLIKYIQDLKRENANLEKIAITDILTGAYNRRKFEDDLKSVAIIKQKYDIPFSYIFFDIDNFKSVNDYYGHKTGDYVLRRISELVLSNIRSTDRLYRWGGDEFIVFLFDTDLVAAEKAAEKIKKRIEQRDFGIKKEINISLGVGEYRAGENSDQLVSKIDKILYESKMRRRSGVGV